MKRKWNRLLALLLCVLMISSELSGLTAVYAKADPAPAAPTPTVVTNTGDQGDFRSDANGRPNLFVSFLGDNNNYIYDPTGVNAGVAGAKKVTTSLQTISIPAPYDQSTATNTTGPGNTWGQYLTTDCASTHVDKTVFWVGLGVDRVELLKLLESGQGLESLEAGFYYDSRIIEPYIDPTALPTGVTLAAATEEQKQEAYRKTIAKANIANPNYPANTQWSSDYTVVRAVPGVKPPETDPVTREEMNTATIGDILNDSLASVAGQNDWKMTYVSLELTDVEKAAAVRRLKGVYKGVDSLETGETAEGETAPITPASAQGDQYVTDGDNTSGYDYNYLLLIPFRLKSYGSIDWTPLRLVRDATHLSIGGGTWGVDEYGAWERTTTRNPEVAAVAGDGTTTLGVEGHPARDLKLLTRFAGDLNLFTAGRTAELEYDALLRIIGDGGSLNYAKLTVDGDPAVWPVFADTNGDVIGGLQSGQGMRLDVHTQDNYVATVTVTYIQDNGSSTGETVYHAYNQVIDGDNDDMYKFVMPAFIPVGARRVTVTVTFAYKTGDNALIYLTELPQPGDAGYAVGNEATIRTSLSSTYADTANTETINSFSSTSEHPNYSHPNVTNHPDRTPVANAKKDQNVEISVETHADYVAVVRVYDFRAQQFMTSGLTINATGATGVVPSTEMIANPDHATDPTAPATIPGPNYGKITMPQGGTIRLTMGSQDLDVEIAYEKGRRYQATLEVYNDNADAVNFDLNTAQLVYDRFDALNLPSKAYSSVVYHDYDKPAAGSATPAADDHRAIKGTDKLPWVSASQAAVSGSLGGDTGRTGKTWNPKDLPTAEDKVIGGKTVMALLAGSANKSDFRAAVNGMDLVGVKLDDGSTDGLTGLRKNIAGELYGDSDISAPLDANVDDPTVIDVLWELREAINADTTTGGLKDTYLKTVKKDDGSVAYTYYDLTPTQVQAYLLEVFAAKELKAENDLAYRMASRRYLTVLTRYNELKKDAAYNGMVELKAPAKNLSTTVKDGKREYQGADYKDTYLVDYDQYLTDYEDYMDALEAHAGTGGADAPTFTGTYPGATAPAKKSVALLSHADAAAKLAAATWEEPSVPTEPIPGINAKLEGNTVETRSGRRVYIVLEADSAYELDTANTDIFTRGAAPGYATGTRITTPTGVTPVAVPGYKNVYSFIMPEQDCVVRVAYKLRDTRKLNITYKDAAGLDDNEAVVEAYSVADPAAVTPKLNVVTNKGYTSATLPSGGTYDPYNDVYKPDSIDKVFRGSVVTIRGKAADGYEIKSVEAKNSDDTTITVTKRQADDPADGYIYTFTVAEGRSDDISLTITYGPEVEEEYTATIQSSTEGAVNGGNKATWYVVNGATVTTPTVQTNVRPGTHLVGHVHVAPGYYIKAVTASGASGDYSFTLTGDGYNNGYGTALTGTDVPIDIYVDMPHEDLVVDVVFAKGPPTPAPANTLTLIVKDKDNTETDLTKAAPNWARARVFADRPADLTAVLTAEQDLPTVGALPGDVVGKNSAKGNGTLTDRKYVDAGKWVLVDFSAAVVMKADTSPGAAPGAQVVDTDKSYYVSSVTVGPDNLGAALIWEGPTQVSFYMPQGSTAVTVEFSKYPPNGRLPDYVLTVRETYTDLNAGAPIPPGTDEYSYITSARSQTIGRWSTITEGVNTVPGRALAWDTNPERVPPLDDPTLSDQATGAATAGEEVTMTFDVDEGDGTAANPGWYYQSVVLISNGAATRLTTNVTEKSRALKTVNGKTTTIVTYQVKFHMPTSAAEFVVHYRKGPKPAIPDYAFTLTIDDPHNVYRPADLKWDDNSVTAEFHDPTGAAAITHPSLDVGRNKASMTAVQHIHAGDVITLKTDLDPGYYLQYMIVNPAGLRICPVWTDADTATFVMPTEGVAVIAKVVKGTPQQYTANLILRYEDENGREILPTGKTINDIGRGTFVLPDPANPGATIGSFDDYAKKAIYSTVQLPGTNVDYDLYAFDGYYIDRITIEPVILGVTGSLSGSCGYQYGDFTMPRASVNVNVWFKSGYPDEIPYDLTIKVHDSSLKPGAALTPKEDYNYAALRTVSGRVPAPTVLAGDQTPVFGGQTKVIDRDDYVLDRDVVILDIHTAPKKNPGDLDFYVDDSCIQIRDSRGDKVDWWYVPGGIAFVQPPRAVTAEITFRQGVPANKYQATLHLEGFQGNDNSVDKDIVNDFVLLSAQAGNTHAQTTAQAAGTTAPPAAVNENGKVITDLYHGDALDLSVRPGSPHHVSAAYAVTTAGDIIPIYGYDAAGTTLTADKAQYVPGKPGTPSIVSPPTAAVPGTVTKGAFAMPQSDVDVYVKFASGPVGPTDQAVNLVVSGPAGAGDATAVIDESVAADQTMTVAAPGMDGRFTAQGNETVVTFAPDTANGYDIIKLEVTNNLTGAHVPYSWISVLQDPSIIDNSAQNNSNLWPGVAPAPGVTHPGWKPNPKKQIRLEVPSGGVTVHVTYGKVSTEPFRAQVVVNDPLAGTKITSKNNAWLSQQSGTDTDDKTLKKLQEAKPGEWVDLDITVHPGYRIEFVKVIPQSFGIVPGLPIGTDMGGGVTYYLHDQKTGFVMPNGDCTVYVKFVADGVATKNATLVVNGAPTGNSANHATIQSPASGTKGPVYVNGTPQSVTARPGVDWVTSEYYWDTATSSVASISVTLAGTDTPVPFTQDIDPATGHGRITFPMSSDDVLVTITYQNDPTPVGQQVVLHVIDKDRLTDATAKPILGDANNDGTMDNYGLLSYTAPAGYPAGYVSTATDKIAPDVPEATATILVPAGQTVDVTACSDASTLGLDGNGKVYIESAYVLFHQSGQMVNFNLTPNALISGMAGPGYCGLHDESSFTVHPGRNDVYVTLTRRAPTADEHAAVLMIRSPADDVQSEAGIHADQTKTAWNDADPAKRDKVRANDPDDTHAYVVAKDGDKVTISVEPASGYIIDYVQITPLGFPLDTHSAYHYDRTGNTITFDMPHVNVGITVYLKRGSNQDYTATLHFVQDPNCPAGNLPQAEDYAKLSWTPDGQTASTSIWADAKTGNTAGTTTDWPDVSSMIVKEGSTVTLDATLDTNAATGKSDVILSAFVVWKDRGSIVRLTPTYPTGRTIQQGLEGVTESASGVPDNDNTKPDGTATFTMPMGDVEVYVVVTTVPPTEPWHTVALVATDHSPKGNNLAENKGDLWNNTTPADKRTAVSNTGVIAWTTVTETETFSVLPKAAPGYHFDDPAVMTGNDGTTKNLSTLYANFLYEVSSILCNQVVRIDFESGDALELTVEIEDPDNPGDGTVEQAVTADPAGNTPPTLRLTSTSVAGSYQIISGIAANDTVELTATPAPGYSAYAQLHTYDGKVTNVPLTDADSDGTFTGSFPMPAQNARVVITFYKGYTGTLTLVNRISGDTTGQATMKEDKRGLTPLLVSSLSTTDSFTGLPNATRLDAQVTSDMTGRKVTGLLTVKGSTTLLSATSSGTVGDPDHFYHTIDRADAEITLVLESQTEHPKSYLAAVRTVDMPTGTTAPTIATSSTGQVSGSIWTTANSADTVTVHASVPAGYRVDVTANRADGTAVTIAPTQLTADGNATFTMPAANVQVTVTYRKVIFDLKLRVVDTSGTGVVNTTAVTPDSAYVVADGPDLTADGQTMKVKAGGAVDVSATPDQTAVTAPDHQPHVVGVYYQTADGVTVWLQNTALAGGAVYNQTNAFAMPAADTTVTVIYDKTTENGPVPDPDYYIASVEVVDPDHQSGNRAVSLVDVPDAGLPGDSPNWIAAYFGSGVKVSYEVQSGYYVTVTAKQADGTSIPVLQLGSSANGTGTVTMPAANIIITLTYSTTKPTQENDVALQLIGHKAEKDNTATTTNATVTTRIQGLTTHGETTTHAPHIPAYTDPEDPVETVKPEALLGDDLRTLADAAAGSHVLRMTVAVRKVTKDTTTGEITAIDETPEVELLVSRYMDSATSRAPTPIAKPGEEVVIRVYYSEVYKATFHLVGEDATDGHTATDAHKTSGALLTYTSAYDSANTAITKPIKNHLDRFEGYQGDGNEDIRTTAVAGAGRRVVDVVWESDLTGAASATPVGSDRYDFTMPRDDVDFYAFFEKDDPDNRSYVAKVAFDPDSVHQDSADNAVTIKNLTDTAASGGKYWVAAKDKDEIEITVKVAKGYQAQVVSTKIDDPTKLGDLPDIFDGTTTRKPTATDEFQYYIDRTQFVYNLPTGKTTTFTMPKDTDATVTIKFTQGYDLTMELDDQTLLPTAGTTTNKTASEVTDKTVSTKDYGLINNKTENTSAGKKTTNATTANEGATVNVGSGNRFITLHLDRGGDVNNTVEMYATAVPGSVVTGNNSKITGLTNGTDITLKINLAPGYKCRVNVVRDEDKTNIVAPRDVTVNETLTFKARTQLYPQVIARVTFVPVTTPTLLSLADLSAVADAFSQASLSAATGKALGGTGNNNTLHDLPGDLQVGTDVTVDPTLNNVQVTHFQTTPFAGTRTIAPNTATGSGQPDYKFIMGYEDTLGTTLLKNDTDPDNLLAKVELDGASDVNGNTAEPIVDHTDTAVNTEDTNSDGTPDAPANITTTGSVWTTTDGKHVIDLKLSVAKGYVAKIKVRRDDSVDPANPTDESKWKFLDAKDYAFQRVWEEAGATAGTTQEKSEPMTTSSGITEVKVGYSAEALPQQLFPDSIGGEQHFRFVMPETRAESATGAGDGDTETDVTVIVKFEKVSDIPRPFDPRHDEDLTPSFLDQGFIYGENRGDFAVVEIPTLADDESETAKRLHDTDNYGPDPGAPATKPVATQVKRFNFYIRTVAENGAETYTRLDPTKDILLVPYDPDDLRAPGDPYNYYKGEAEGMWTGTELWKDTTAGAKKKDFVGSKFLLYPTEPDAKTGKRTDGAQKLYDILNNKGSLETYEVPKEGSTTEKVTKYRTTLFVQAEDATSTSDYTEVWIRPWFALGVKVSSYGPTHPLEGELYRLMTAEELDKKTGWLLPNGDPNPTPPTGVTSTTPDPDNLQHYKWDSKTEPTFTDSVVLEGEGSGKWMQILRIRSSDLLGGFDKDYDPSEKVSDPAQPTDRTLLDNVDAGENLTYTLMLNKAANLTYTRIKLDLNPANYTTTPLTDYYENGDYKTRTFMLQDTIQLIAGDVDENGKTKRQDYDAVYDFVYRSRRWSDLAEEPVPPLKADGVTVDTAAATYPAYQAALKEWAMSVYNPRTMAYRCDLDGDRNITVVDLNIVNTRFNYNRDETHYNWFKTNGALTEEIMPFGMGPRDSSYAALFGLGMVSEGELFADVYWDANVDPDETEAVPMETYYVDALGRFWVDNEASGTPETPVETHPDQAQTHNERPETPLGEEALDHTPAAPVDEDQAILPETPAIEPEPTAAEDVPTPEPDPAGEGEAASAEAPEPDRAGERAETPEEPPASE